MPGTPNVTQATGDQGVDVIAMKNGMRVVLQCKKYSSPVGNKAVQEIVAGKIHEQAHHAAVVTNNTFTSSALQLASTNGVKLLHVTELSDFANTIEGCD
jgi:restriction system protein